MGRVHIVTAFLSLLLLTFAANADIVFVTSTVTNGNMGGLSGADAICQSRAAAAGLPGTYLAFLSTGGVNARDRIIQSTAPYQLVNGTIVANNWADLTDGTLAAQIKLSETGADLTQSSTVFVWTATNADFTYYGQNCGINWDSTQVRTMAGVLTSNSPTWTAAGVQPCAAAVHLYCFQQVALRSISGRVTSISGRPITHARIVVTSSSLVAPLTFYSRRDGTYTIPNLSSSQTYTLTVSHRRFTFNPASVNVNLDSSNITNANFTSN